MLCLQIQEKVRQPLLTYTQVLWSVSHWVCYRKDYKTGYYFNSFGNLKPPNKLLRYFGALFEIHC